MRDLFQEFRQLRIVEADLAASKQISSPRQACSNANGTTLAQACGAQATGYSTGAMPRRRGKPQNSSGKRIISMWPAAANRPSKMAAAAFFWP